MDRLCVAAGTGFAADAGAAMAELGGNAVDAAVAATFMTWVCEPGLTSPGSGGFCCIWPPNDEPVTIDGMVEMPGRTADKEAFGRIDVVTFDYGGGTTTAVGPGSVGTPGALAALEMAWKRYGKLPWRDLAAPAIERARQGVPLPGAAHRYFRVSGEAIFSRTPGARRFFEAEDGRRLDAGELIRFPDLADALDLIAREGARAMYRGDLGRRIGRWMRDQGALLGPDDFRGYRALLRPCLRTDVGRWHLVTNPPPAVGGVALTEIASLMEGSPQERWTARDIARFASVMAVAFTDRRELLASGDIESAADTLLETGLTARRSRLTEPGSTSHTSVVDREGWACSITTSTGYASGVIVPGTGIMLNNSLGERELSPHGPHTVPPGQRMRSNMAPSVVRSDGGHVIAFGAAGADRIASSLAQVWLNMANLRMSLADAVTHPRCHLDWREGVPTLAHEPGIDVSLIDLATFPFQERHMFFGGVQAAERHGDGTLDAVGDPRRAGGHAKG
jgi:gamma-glutamyltranspeptidase/glutathione hydrolase